MRAKSGGNSGGNDDCSIRNTRHDADGQGMLLFILLPRLRFPGFLFFFSICLSCGGRQASQSEFPLDDSSSTTANISDYFLTFILSSFKISIRYRYL